MQSNLTGLKKEPKQPRARQTVTRIIDATAELVRELGVDGITTNKVAERANVNIASLYQYFPNKQALISALLQRYLNEITQVLNQVLVQLGDASVEESSRAWAQMSIQYYRQSDGVFTEILKNQYANTTLPEMREFEHRLMEAIRRFLVKQRDQLQVEDLDLSIYIAFSACTSVIAKHVMEPVPYYTDEQVVEEVVKLMVRYFY